MDRSGRAVQGEDGGGQGCLWDIELGRCRTEVESHHEAGASPGSLSIINMDLNGPLIFTQPNKDAGIEIFAKANKDVGVEIFTQPGEDLGQLIFTKPGELPTCNIFADNRDLEKQLGITPDFVTNSDPNDLPHRPGLPRRTEREWRKKGQLTDDEFEFLRQFAQKRGKKIILTGSLSETPWGIENRIKHPERLPGWRRGEDGSSAMPSLVHPDKAGKIKDIDFWEGSDLSGPERAEISAYFQPNAQNPNVPIPVDAGPDGYSSLLYPLQRSFKEPARDVGGREAGDGGGIVFYPSGRTERLPATWQVELWP
jgi:hypothetical protein